DSIVCGGGGRKTKSISLLHIILYSVRVVWRRVFTPYADIARHDFKQYRLMSIIAICNICFVVFVFNPYSVYSSDVSQFDITQIRSTLAKLFGWFLLFSFVFIYFISFVYKTRLFKVCVWALCVLMFMATCYSAIFVRDCEFNTYGLLDNFVFQGGVSVYNPKNKYFDIIFGLCSMVVVFVLIYKRFFIHFAFVCGVVFVSFALRDAIKILSVDISQKVYDNVLPPYNDKLLSFSQDSNILVLVLDAFTGSHLDIILQQEDLREKLSGFTYYNNTLATSNNTQFNTPALMGGEKYTSLSLYNQGVRNAQDSYDEAFFILPEKLLQKGYKVAVYDTVPVLPTTFESYFGDTVLVANQDKQSYIGSFIHHYNLGDFIQTQFDEIRKKQDSVAILFAIGLFKAAPYTMRVRIYGDGQWLFAKKNLSDELATQLRYVSDVAMFPFVSNTNSQRKTFKYIKSMITHYPWQLDLENQCAPNVFAQSSLPELYQAFMPKEYRNGYNDKHYNNEYCAIKFVLDWLDWFRENDIYDKSAIVIVSDHGHYDSFSQIQNNNFEQLGTQSDALLLVKPFGAKGKLRIDSGLKSNADVYTMVCKFAALNCDNMADIHATNRILYHTNSPFTEHLEIDRAYRVRENIFESHNWEDISQEIKDLKQNL
uniref:hypothetical protein n=1 Tax=Helicobacter cinaedi TaxID=213 RepID=UPI0020C3C7F3